MFLDRLARRPGHVGEGFPWTVPLIANLRDLHLTTAVTLLVGENGCGKSTLLEGMAWGADATAIGSHRMESDPTLASARRFHEGFRRCWRCRAPPSCRQMAAGWSLPSGMTWSMSGSPGHS